MTPFATPAAGFEASACEKLAEGLTGGALEEQTARAKLMGSGPLVPR